MPFVTADSVKSLQQAIAAEVTTLGSAVVKCTTIPQADADEFRALKNRALAFVGKSPSTLTAPAQMDEGQQIQRDMAPWHARLNALGCPVGPAPAQPPAATDLFANIGDTIKWLVIGFVAYELFAGANKR
jgi:hypothetical protein